MKGHGPTLEKKRSDYAIRSSVAISKLPLGRDILKKKKKKKKNTKEKCYFLKIFFFWIFLTFGLSYSTYSIVTGSGAQQVNFMEKFCVKAGISCRSILLASERSERDTIRGVQIRAGAVHIYIYLITLIPRNITSQLQCISASAAGTSAIPVTDE